MIFRTAGLWPAHDHERVARSNLRAETLAVRMNMKRRATSARRLLRAQWRAPSNDIRVRHSRVAGNPENGADDRVDRPAQQPADDIEIPAKLGAHHRQEEEQTDDDGHAVALQPRQGHVEYYW